MSPSRRDTARRTDGNAGSGASGRPLLLLPCSARGKDSRRARSRLGKSLLIAPVAIRPDCPAPKWTCVWLGNNCATCTWRRQRYIRECSWCSSSISSCVIKSIGDARRNRRLLRREPASLLRRYGPIGKRTRSVTGEDAIPASPTTRPDAAGNCTHLACDGTTDSSPEWTRDERWSDGRPGGSRASNCRATITSACSAEGGFRRKSWGIHVQCPFGYRHLAVVVRRHFRDQEGEFLGYIDAHEKLLIYVRISISEREDHLGDLARPA